MQLTRPLTASCCVQGYAIGSAGLASFLLFSAYLDEVAAFARAPFTQASAGARSLCLDACAGWQGGRPRFMFHLGIAPAAKRLRQSVKLTLHASITAALLTPTLLNSCRRSLPCQMSPSDLQPAVLPPRCKPSVLRAATSRCKQSPLPRSPLLPLTAGGHCGARSLHRWPPGSYGRLPLHRLVLCGGGQDSTGTCWDAGSDSGSVPRGRERPLRPVPHLNPHLNPWGCAW